MKYFPFEVCVFADRATPNNQYTSTQDVNDALLSLFFISRPIEVIYLRFTLCAITCRAPSTSRRIRCTLNSECAMLGVSPHWHHIKDRRFLRTLTHKKGYLCGGVGRAKLILKNWAAIARARGEVIGRQDKLQPVRLARISREHFTRIARSFQFNDK